MVIQIRAHYGLDW
ncbi:hypothetical protein F383_37318 [Gossypium arboreum]|uniref:Uncharacterized protein n=1 Tax=Gossypium arboreum TaxID=29729 RepID=A0A0B0MCF2_GOSAR|nr:hypothetical protein F383_37318 [Gossypium arboreum]